MAPMIAASRVSPSATTIVSSPSLSRRGPRAPPAGARRPPPAPPADQRTLGILKTTVVAADHGGPPGKTLPTVPSPSPARQRAVLAGAPWRHEGFAWTRRNLAWRSL